MCNFFPIFEAIFDLYQRALLPTNYLQASTLPLVANETKKDKHECKKDSLIWRNHAIVSILRK